MPMIALRYDLRVPGFASTTHAEQYAACLEQAAWADERGLDAVTFSEHHGTDDGYLPAPLTLAAAVAGRTRRIQITVAAALVPLHDPVRLAEQIATLDLLSGGRVTTVAGLGYRPEELEMAGVEPSRRGALLEEHLEVMRRAWSGEPFEWRGRTIRVTPTPMTRPHPLLMVGGSTAAAARRAARLRLPFFPAVGDPALAEVYEEECARVGFDGGFCSLPSGPGMVMVAEDPDKVWEQVAPHALFDARTYARWQPPGQRSVVHTDAQDHDELRRSGVYRVVTPDECVAMAEAMGDLGTLVLHPLVGGLAPEPAWESLELFEAEVLPRLRRSSPPSGPARP
ncbi:MAG: LLM class flavin-dependent oxidoreductase [Acidimicrobiia bacterium]|nr:LLM class flavin-dependent oxidoreductase [Acidimicrobiia bacterium]